MKWQVDSHENKAQMDEKKTDLKGMNKWIWKSKTDLQVDTHHEC